MPVKSKFTIGCTISKYVHNALGRIITFCNPCQYCLKNMLDALHFLHAKNAHGVKQRCNPKYGCLDSLEVVVSTECQKEDEEKG